MATDNKQIQDPREIGTKGLSGLSHERPDNLHFGTSADEYRILQNFKNKNASPVEYLGNYYPEAGSSKYDTEVESLTDLEDLNEFRAQTQPWYDQIANGALKMVTTAATTFVDGTLGTLMGLGTGVANLMDDDPSKIAKAISISRKCLNIVYENTVFAISVKFICLILGALGIANMWYAIFADVGVTVLAVLNAIRALFVKKL